MKTKVALVLLAAAVALSGCAASSPRIGPSESGLGSTYLSDPDAEGSDDVEDVAEGLGVPSTRQDELAALMAAVAALDSEGFPSGISYDSEREAFILNTDAPPELTEPLIAGHPGLVVVPGGVVGQ